MNPMMKNYLTNLCGSEFVKSLDGPAAALREPTISVDPPPIGPSDEQSAPLYPDGRGHPLADNVEHPHDEDGIVGAFCRAYDDIETAIAEFLPDVYTPPDQHEQAAEDGLKNLTAIIRGIRWV